MKKSGLSRQIRQVNLCLQIFTMYLWISFEAGVNLPLDCLAQVEKFVDFVESWFDTRKAIGKFWLSLVLHMSYSELKEAFQFSLRFNT